MNPKAIQVEAVSLMLQGHSILENVSLDIEPIDFVALIGPNGGGKTTLLKIILGLIHPNKGSVRIFGHPPQLGTKFVGYVPQYSEIDRNIPLSVLDVTLMGRTASHRMFRRFSKLDRQVASKALEQVGLLDRLNQPIGTLSGGQLQRVMIARALATEPKILLLDEPTANLDRSIGKGLYQLLDQLSQSLAILMVTHDIGVISKHVRRLACLNRRLYHSDSNTISAEMLEEAYECPFDLVAHGEVPHRVLGEHH